MSETVQQAPTIEEAISLALDVLGAAEDEVEYEVLVQPEHHVFGKDVQAEVRVWLVNESSDGPVDERLGESPDATVPGFNEEDDGSVEDDEASDVESDVSMEKGFADNVSDDGSVICDDERQSFTKEPGELSEEELDQVADTAIDVLRSILSYFDADDAGIDEYEGDEGEIQLDVVGDDMAVLIGRHGRTLDALQYTVVSATNKRLGFRYPIVIDVEGYKYRRRQKIEGLARSAASKASNQGKNIRLRPMTSYERRIVHLALRDDRRVTTVSEGEEPNRRVVVKPQR